MSILSYQKKRNNLKKENFYLRKVASFIIHWNYNYALIFNNILIVMFSCVRKCSYNKAEQIIQFSAFGWQNWKKKLKDKHICKKNY